MVTFGLPQTGEVRRTIHLPHITMGTGIKSHVCHNVSFILMVNFDLNEEQKRAISSAEAPYPPCDPTLYSMIHNQ